MGRRSRALSRSSRLSHAPVVSTSLMATSCQTPVGRPADGPIFSDRPPWSSRAGGEDLAGVHDAERVEDGFEPALPLELGRTQLESQPRDLDRADAVLTGDRPAEGEPEPDHVVEGLPGAGQTVGVVVGVD